MQTNKLLTILFTTLWLTSCASIPNSPPAQNTTQKWDTRASTLADIHHWDLQAVVGIQNKIKNENVTANLKWQQVNNTYTIQLFGPLGAGAAKLTGTPGHVTLETSDGKTYKAATPEELLGQQTGWNLPVSNLYYWIRGLPVPNVAATKQFDAYHHLTELEQQGWQIHFMRYTSINQIDVPDKIFLNNPQLNVKIVIKDWKI